MKKILSTLLFLSMCHVFYGQEKKSIKYLPQIIIDACNCPNRVIETDSVYSFLRSAPLETIAHGNALIVLVDNPVPHNEVASEYKISGNTMNLYLFTKNILINKLDKNIKEKHKMMYYKWWYRNDEIMPSEAYTELLAATWDSTVTYTQKIDTWDIFRIRDNWFTEKQHERLYKQIKEVNKVTPYFSDMNFTVPVFDKSYNYAVIILKYNLKYYPYLFKREGGKWVIIYRQ